MRKMFKTKKAITYTADVSIPWNLIAEKLADADETEQAEFFNAFCAACEIWGVAKYCDQFLAIKDHLFSNSKYVLATLGDHVQD